MSNQIIIIKSDGTQTQAMAQEQAKSYLGNLIYENRLANLSQSLNDVTGGGGKPTGDYTFAGHRVLHASSGKVGVKSVSLFYYDDNDDHYIIAMGEHVSSNAYKLSDYGQPDGDFKGDRTIALS